jgi:methyl-accepting chemotaxis protein
MNASAVSVAEGMGKASESLTTVASSTEEMTATIAEIAGSSEKARMITLDVKEKTSQISGLLSRLGAAAQEIGKVTETINGISSQTNLLALNATIEAARAGAAGKGFAVVANEIKELAQQTAVATEDIKAKVSGIQSSTSGTIEEIGRIAGVINEVNDIVSTIATAITEQAAVTKDIARNIVQASAGVNEANERVSRSTTVSRSIARDIAVVSQASGDMTLGSDQVRTSSGELSKLAEGLKALVDQFVA